jgi:hypothetical protein
MQHYSVFNNQDIHSTRSGMAVLSLGAMGGVMLMGAFIVGASMLGLMMIAGAVASLVLQVFFGIDYVAQQHEHLTQLANTQPAIYIEDQLLTGSDWEEIVGA